MLRFIVVGTGRCGTGYVAALMSNLGLPTGHEYVHTPHGIRTPPKHMLGDSSWLAAPFLSRYLDVHIIHLIRDRDNTINSLNEIGFFDPTVDHGAYRQFLHSYAPHIQTADEHYDYWNGLIEPYAHATWQLEEINAADVRALLAATEIPPLSEQRITKIISNLPTNINTSVEEEEVDWWMQDV